ncbi:MAG TPA: hypothetical protein VKR06_38500 [Ktedonosporobacter sp.]|nr:hypothetical protein [Ktedonosporobacter sp.]
MPGRKTKPTIQTLARVYSDLATGREDFRYALGTFMNAFFMDYMDKDERQSLINDPIQVEDHPTEQQRGWAAFCAGAAEYLADHYELQCPAWAASPAYQMPEPWYILPNANNAAKEHFQKTTPLAFRCRNVFCGDRVFTNAHPSSREPGNIRELQRMREALLATLSPSERETYLAKRRGKPRITTITT